MRTQMDKHLHKRVPKELQWDDTRCRLGRTFPLLHILPMCTVTCSYTAELHDLLNSVQWRFPYPSPMFMVTSMYRWLTQCSQSCARWCHVHHWSQSRTGSSLHLRPMPDFFNIFYFFLLHQGDPLWVSAIGLSLWNTETLLLLLSLPCWQGWSVRLHFANSHGLCAPPVH